ncbi:Autophagy protein [Homalodisca vitripennis]|nr:Autophagy protein [Homalodisca vitripennis]
MGPKEFERVEQQLLNELHPVTTRGLHTVQGWSSAPLDDSDEEFFPMAGNSRSLSGSMFSDATSLNASFSSSCSSFSKTSTSVTSYNPKSSSVHMKKRRKSTRTRVDGGMGAEESRLHVKLSSLAVVLLHEDILILSPETGQITESSLEQMSRTADQFFSKLGLFAASGYGKKDFEYARKILVFNDAQPNSMAGLAKS